MAAAVWVTWRTVTWRRSGGDLARETVISVLFAWGLVVVRFALFPLTIIFYDWHGRFSLIPFASITQLVRETSFATAFENIVGNLLLLAPLGLLLPLLFRQIQRPRSLLWRVAVISLCIEVIQLFTRARAVDVDDVILNVAGSTLGYGMYLVIRSIAQRSSEGSGLLDRIGAEPSREPLTLAAVPVLATIAIVVPVMVWTVFAATLADGPTGIVDDATAPWPEGTVVARADVGSDTFLLVRTDYDVTAQMVLVGYEMVLPGRFTRVLSSEPVRVEGSHYRWGITPYNTLRDEVPTFFVWGSNQVGAARLIVQGAAVSERLVLPDQPFFVVGVRSRLDETAPDLRDIRLQFLDSTGVDVTDRFQSLDG